MKKTLLLIFLTALPLQALSADVICPEGILDGKIHKGEVATEGASLCYQGMSYPKNLVYCAPYSGGRNGFYDPLDFKCVDKKVMSKQEDYCFKGDFGPGGIFRTLDRYCKNGGIYYKLNNFKTN